MKMEAVIADIDQARRTIASAAQTKTGFTTEEAWGGGYTKVPSLSGAFTQHASFWSGQPGDAVTAITKLNDDLDWSGTMLGSVADALQHQEETTSKAFDNFDMAAHERGVGSFSCFQPRDTEPFKNLNYLHPASIVEPLYSVKLMIALIQDSDAAPIAAAEKWRGTAAELQAVAEQLMATSSGLGARNKGRAFDEARNALEDFAKRSRTVSANAALMAESAAQFPLVRQKNLEELLEIAAKVTAANAGAPGSGEIMEGAEMARFVSTHLQPSLELLKPPVHNFGVPVVGHNGGGGVNITSFNTTGPAEAFQAINGNVAPATANNVQELGAQTADAVTDAGRGNAAANAPAAGNTSPAAGEHLPASQQHVAPAGANPAAPAGPGVAPAGTQLPANTPAHTAGMPGGAPSNAAAPGLALPGTNQRGANGSPNARGAQPARPALPTTGAHRPNAGHAPVPRAGSAPHGTGAHSALRNAPGLGGAEATGERTGSRNHGYGTPATTGQGRAPRTTVVRPELPAAHPENLRNGVAGRGLHGVGAPGTPNGAPHTGMHGTSHGSPTTATPHADAQSNQRGRGFYGGMAPGARGGAANTGRQVKPGAGQWASSVSEYFKRQFLGAKPRTTKKVISR
ncbi:hypothetical protein QP140_02135 [Corynebacterium sp. UMB9976]|uniref:hypothetical protein n=1 Tax=Corynebacterium sp. UMB9976 TaxID=3046354 RepID=UPI00254B265E|nr:hypothetical protein [Corynebacterium sp. UMB9976]MDK6301395.1 hypothetical protein [Corynebacterium sp. UMB9976]